MLNETALLQVLSLYTLGLFLKAPTILTAWYAAGLYLIVLGLILLPRGDILIGFLWVIDFGVGLIFLIFILHFSNFLYQKVQLNVFRRLILNFWSYALLLIFFLYFIAHSTSINALLFLKQVWFFYVTWYNLYIVYNNTNVSLLQMIREIYFYNNSFEFFLINFILFYGVVCAVLLSFLIKKVSTTLNFLQLKNTIFTRISETSYFIRHQNFSKQQNTSTGTRVWQKLTSYPSNDI